MTSPPRLILFDLMNTLVRVQPEREPYWLSIGEALARAELCDGAEFSERYASRRPAWHGSDRETDLRSRLKEIVPTPDALLDAIEERFVEDYVARSEVLEGVREMLACWAGEASLAVVSNFFVRGAPEKLLIHHGLLEHFGFVVDSADVGYRKPHAEIFRRALDIAGNPDCGDVWMIGDDLRADVGGARALGLRALHFSARSRYDRAIRSWNEFRPHRSHPTSPRNGARDPSTTQKRTASRTRTGEYGELRDRR